MCPPPESDASEDGLRARRSSVVLAWAVWTASAAPLAAQDGELGGWRSYWTAEANYLRRGSGRLLVLAEDWDFNPNVPGSPYTLVPPRFTSDDVVDRYDLAPHLTVGARSGRRGVEVSLWIQSWFAGGMHTPADASTHWVNGMKGVNATNFVNSVRAVRAEEETRVISTEASARRFFGSSNSVLIGLRHVQFRDGFEMTAQGLQFGPNAWGDSLEVNTDNALLGLQVGFDHMASGQAVGLDFSGRLGAFLNLSDVHILERSPLGEQGGLNAVLTDARGDATSVAVVATASVALRLRLAARVGFRVGVSAASFSGLALAADQLAVLGDAADRWHITTTQDLETTRSGVIRFFGLTLGLSAAM